MGSLRKWRERGADALPGRPAFAPARAGLVSSWPDAMRPAEMTAAGRITGGRAPAALRATAGVAPDGAAARESTDGLRRAPGRR